MKVLPNGIAIIEGDTHISKWVQQSGRLDHDQNMLPLVAQYVCGTVIDIGAFIGDHTAFYCTLADAVHAFEPNVEAFNCLKHNCPNAVCYLAAAADHRGHVAIDRNTNAGASHAKAATDGVPCFPVDDLGLTGVGFIKIDCEGFEPQALRGLRRTIEHSQPSMLVEVNEGALQRNGQSPGAIFAILGDLGYKWRNIYRDQPCAGPQYDILAIPLHREWL